MLALVVLALTSAGTILAQRGTRSSDWFPPSLAAGAFLLTVAVILALLSACT